MKLLLLVLVASAGSHLTLEGSSNVTDWRCSGTTLESTMEVASSPAEMDAIIDGIEAFHLRVPVQSLRCGNRQMERDMVRALRGQRHPVIDFQFKELVGDVEADAAGGRYRATISGVLTLAGAQRDVHVAVEAVRVAPNRFRLRARLPLRMTDFRITPPTALFGMVKARDELEVQFDLYLQSRS
jgi:hypothetical protein